MFQFPGFALKTLCIQVISTCLALLLIASPRRSRLRPRAGAERTLRSNNNKTSGGFPHSDIHGSKPVPGSPWLNAGYHVLHRLLLPRHPPNALFALDLIQKEHDRAGSSQSSFQCQKLYTFPCNDPKIVAVSVLDLNNIALMRHASGHPSLGRPAILMLYLSKRCQISVWDQTSKTCAQGLLI